MSSSDRLTCTRLIGLSEKSVERERERLRAIVTRQVVGGPGSQADSDDSRCLVLLLLLLLHFAVGSRPHSSPPPQPQVEKTPSFFFDHEQDSTR